VSVLRHRAEISKAEVAKQVRGIHHEKKVGILLLFCGFWSDLAKNFTRLFFPYSPTLCQVLSK